MRTRIKICGITRLDDALAAVDVGVDALGLNFVPESVRFLDRERAGQLVASLPTGIDIVGVFANAPLDAIREAVNQTGVTTIQLHGDEPPEYVVALAPHRVVKAFRWRGPETASEIDSFVERARDLGRLPAAVLIDSYQKGKMGGTGAAWSWNAMGTWRPAVPWLLAGGLTPANVAEAMRGTSPFAVDVAGGVEVTPGIKDFDKMRTFVRAVVEADRHAWEALKEGLAAKSP